MSCSPPLSKRQKVSPLEFSITIPKISLHSELGFDASLIILSMLSHRDLLKLSSVQRVWTRPARAMFWNTKEGANVYGQWMHEAKETADFFFEFIKDFGVRRIVINHSAPKYLIKMQGHPMLEQLSIKNSPDLNQDDFSRVNPLLIREIRLCKVSLLTGEWFQEGFQGLSKLKIEQCEKINNEALKLISSKKTIQSLTIWDCGKITDLGVKHLVELKQMTKLNLAPCMELTDKSLEYLKDLPLVKLALQMCWKITLGGVGFLNNPLTCLDYRKSFTSGFDYISVKKL